MKCKKVYKHMFSRSGMYIGCKEVTEYDYAKMFGMIMFATAFVIMIIYNIGSIEMSSIRPHSTGVEAIEVQR